MPQQSASVNKAAARAHTSRHSSDSLWLYEASPETKRDGRAAVQHITQNPSA